MNTGSKILQENPFERGKACKMRPKKQEEHQSRIFQSRLDQMIDMEHPLVRLSTRIHWPVLEKKLGEVYIPDKGRPALPTRLMASLHYLKGMFKLSDEGVVDVNGAEKKHEKGGQKMSFFVDERDRTQAFRSYRVLTICCFCFMNSFRSFSR